MNLRARNLCLACFSNFVHKAIFRKKIFYFLKNICINKSGKKSMRLGLAKVYVSHGFMSSGKLF